MFVLAIASLFSVVCLANDNDSILVPDSGKIVNVLNTKNLEGEKINRLLLLKDGCFTGDQLIIIDKLHDIFDSTYKNPYAMKWNFTFNNVSQVFEGGQGDKLQIIYIVRNAPGYSKFVIKRCK